MSQNETQPPVYAPKYSVVAAAYNVGRFIDKFLESLASQSLDHDKFEVIIVNDGSDDDTDDRVRRFSETTDLRVLLITQENQGQGEARNAGIRAARGEWITFPDPDDWLSPDYLECVNSWIQSNQDIDMIATNRIMYQEATGVYEDRHPLRRHFFQDHNIALNRFPAYFHGSAPAAFFRLRTINENNLEFSPLIRSNFEDGHFCVSYLLSKRTPTVSFLKSAKYIYRKRADNSSTLQNKHTDPEHFIGSPRNGYLDCLKKASISQRGRVPEWLQNFILYELSWYFTEDHQMRIPTVATGDVGAEFRSILAEIASYLDPAVVYAFDIRRFPLAAKESLLHGFSGDSWSTPYIVMDRVDQIKKLARFVYRYTGVAPVVTFELAGIPSRPVHQKRRSIEYFGAEVVTEVVAWVSYAHTITVRIDGQGLPIRQFWPPAQRFSLRPAQLRHAFRIGMNPPTPRSLKKRVVPKRRKRANRMSFKQWAARSVISEWKYRRGWVLMDRIGDADDSAEILFAHVRKNHPHINARFVISRKALAWDHLRKEYGSRVVAYGSWEWKAVLTFAEFVISSHADQGITNPPAFRAFGGRARWKFVFLQHGVIKDDISRWMNLKDFSLFIASTEAEYNSLAGDHTPYTVTSKEVLLSGLPRFDAFDRLEAVRGDTPPRKIVFAPTWRDWLTATLAPGQTIREINADFLETEYAENWLGLIASDEVRIAAESSGCTIALLPHPNLRKLTDMLELPSYIELLNFEDGNAQKNFVDAAMLVTDYSSMAFNAAYLRRPIVYFQFDRSRYDAGAHISRPGYFDYQREGFGPCEQDLEGAIATVSSLINMDLIPPVEYTKRMDIAFPKREGSASERVVRGIKKLGMTSPVRSLGRVEG